MRKLFGATAIGLLAGIATAANTWYLAPAPAGSDDYDGTSSNFVSGTVGPMESFSNLMSRVDAGDTIVLMPGEHSAGSMDDALANHTSSRAHITKNNVTIRSYSGNPADTAIVGESEGDAWSTEGADQIRCISIAKNATGCVIDGVTLKDGVACAGGSLGVGRGNGGGVYDLSKSCWLIGCVVTNCTAYGGGGVYGANAFRTQFIDCKAKITAYGAAMYLGGTAAFCLFDRCQKTKVNGSLARTLGGDAAATKIYNCTFVGATSGVLYNKEGDGYTVVNSISVGNKNGDNASDAAAGASTLITARRSVFTACAEAKTESTYDNCQTGVTRADVGFCTDAADCWRVAATSPAATVGDAAELSAVTLPAGYTMKDLYGNPVPSSGPIAAGCALVRTGVYVDVAHGSDANYGGSPACAKKTIKAAIQVAVAGDVIHVAEGTYSPATEGTQTLATGDLPQTVIVPEGMRLVADGRATHTIIEGQASDEPEDDYGNGVGAVRCVYVSANASVEGFTLTKGHSRYTATGVNADQWGGAAYGASSATSRLVDCLVKENYTCKNVLYITTFPTHKTMRLTA